MGHVAQFCVYVYMGVCGCAWVYLIYERERQSCFLQKEKNLHYIRMTYTDSIYINIYVIHVRLYIFIQFVTDLCRTPIL